MTHLNFYSGSGLDRADALRQDAARLAALMGHRATRFVPVWRSRSFVRTAPAGAVWLSGAAAVELAGRAEEAVFLGLDGAAAFVALDLSAREAPHDEAALAGRGEFRDLRDVGALLARREGAILAYARGLMHWHRRHRYCGRCGGATESCRGGHVRICTNDKCAIEHFPRTDPAVIMLVHDGANCVLARNRDWPAGLHSTLAGFVEPGESLEEAVIREVREEVGLELSLDGVAYQSSQPWPFPTSLMLGFHARAAHAPLTIYQQELQSACWMSRDALLSLAEGDAFKLPSRDSIARRLIEDWLRA